MFDSEAAPADLGAVPIRDAVTMSLPSRRVTGSLTSRLRAETREAHDAVERCTGWPDSIGDRDAYRRCLRGLLSIWRPFEEALGSDGDWAGFEIGRCRLSRVPSLLRDLHALGDDPTTVVSQAIVPPRSLSGRIGAVYVLEGSALGGRVIGTDVRRRLGPAVSDATAFFSGEVQHAGPAWRDIVLAVDAFGAACPDETDDAVCSARATFAAFLQTFRGGASLQATEANPS